MYIKYKIKIILSESYRYVFGTNLIHSLWQVLPVLDAGPADLKPARRGDRGGQPGHVPGADGGPTRRRSADITTRDILHDIPYIYYIVLYSIQIQL